MSFCQTCKKTPPQVALKRCAKCSSTNYCSRDCQKADWKSHRKTCGRQDAGQSSPGSSNRGAAGGAGSPPKGLDLRIPDPFTRLDSGKWLHDRPEVDVYRLLIDSYRMRMEDNYKIEGNADEDSIYGGASDGVVGFRRYLQRVSSKAGLLPSWWTVENVDLCEKLGKAGGEDWYDLGTCIEKSDIIEHYGDPQFPMQLRMFGEAIYGTAPGGMNGTAMRKMLASMEGGGMPGMNSTLFDTTTGNSSRMR